MVIYLLLKFQRALHFVKMKTVLLTFWVFIINSLSFYRSFIIMRPYRGDCELAENSTRLLCLMLPLCAHPWFCSLAWSRSLLHLGLSFSLSPGRLHSLSTGTCCNPSKLSPDFLMKFLIISVPRPKLCLWICLSRTQFILPVTSKSVLAFPLYSLPHTPVGVRSVRDCHACVVALKGYLIMSVELIGCSWCTISVVVSEAPERECPTPWWLKSPLQFTWAFHFTSKQCLRKGLSGFQLSYKYVNYRSSILIPELWGVLYWNIYYLSKNIHCIPYATLRGPIV